MASIFLISYIVLLPALVAGEAYFLGACHDFNTLLDYYAKTQQGINTLHAFGSSGVARMFMWDPSEEERTQSCNFLDLNFDAGTYQYSTTENTVNVTYSGDMTYLLAPLTRLQLESGLPVGILGANDEGFSQMFPLYISSTDIILNSCRGAFLGRLETVYVLTTKSYSEIDLECSQDAVRTAVNKDVIAVDGYANASPSCQPLNP